MNELETALRARYRTPKEVVRALGLDEAVLREPKKPASAVALDEAMRAGMQKLVGMGQDATLQDFAELIDMLKQGNTKAATHEVEELAEEGREEEHDEDERDESNEDEPGEAEEEEEEMEGNSGLPAFAEEKEKKEARDGGNVNAEVAKLLMMAAKKFLGEGGEEEKPAIDEDIDETAEDCAARDADIEDRKEAKDEDPEALKKEEKKELPKPAMDENTVRKIVATSVAAAVDAERKRAERVQVALDEALPYTGRVNGKFNTDVEVYHMALDMLSIPDAKEIRDATALKIILKSQPLPGSNAAPRTERRLAQDAAAAKDTLIRFPHADRLKQRA